MEPQPKKNGPLLASVSSDNRESFVSKDVIDLKWMEVNVPCQHACPIKTDIPGYIEAIIHGDYEKAYLINRLDNIFPGSLGRVCHRPCEPPCRHGRPHLGDPVQICFLKRSAADFGIEPVPIEITENGKRVAIIGAGPSGLTTANDLRLLGYQVKVYEQWDRPGGMLRYGIPQFRLPYEVVAKDIESITDLGVEIICNHRVDTRAEFEQLKADHDAVVLSGGCMLPSSVTLPGMDEAKQGFLWGLDFMVKSNREEMDYKPNKVVVIGGGFTAVDCVRTSYRLGATDCLLAYRRTYNEMSAGKLEIEQMQHEGIGIEILVSPVALKVEDGHVAGLQLVRNRLNEKNRPEPIPGSEFWIECDTVIMAIGQKNEDLDGIDDPWVLEPDDSGKLFIAGDFKNGSGTVIEACADGREVARVVHERLSGRRVEKAVRITEMALDELPRTREHDFIRPQHMPELPLDRRREKNTEVEKGFDKSLAETEAHRCYLCHYNFQIDLDRCIYCMKCIDVMPVDCIKLAKDVIVHDDGNLEYVATKRWDETVAITIDNNECVRCGKCLDACPVECISVSKYQLETFEVDALEPVPSGAQGQP